MNPGTSCRVQSPGYLRLIPTGCLYVFQLPAVAFRAGYPVPATAADCADTDAARAMITDRAARTCLPICRPVNVECDFIEVSRVNEARSVCPLKPMNYTQLSPRAGVGPVGGEFSCGHCRNSRARKTLPRPMHSGTVRLDGSHTRCYSRASMTKSARFLP